ncbi:MAG: DoxX family protein [Ilyomonas sp.]
MKKVFNTQTSSSAIDITLLLGRVGIAALMFTHGLPKLQMLLSGETSQFPSIMGLGATLSLTLAVFSEVFCSIFILTGFATRLATIPLIITMLVAAISVHAADAFATKEKAILFLLVYILLFFMGSGKYSIDHFIHAKKSIAYPARA